MKQYSIFLLLGAGCIEYKLNNELQGSGASFGGVGADEQYIAGYPNPEICDTEDNIVPTYTVMEGCYVEPQSGPLDAVIEWKKESFDLYPEYGQTVMAPVIGQLTDDNGDGIINTFDTPDIVLITDDGGIVANKHGVIRLLSGADGTELKASNRSDVGNDHLDLHFRASCLRFVLASLGLTLSGSSSFSWP